jgi:peptidylamidoglycolate lyase
MIPGQQQSITRGRFLRQAALATGWFAVLRGTVRSAESDLPGYELDPTWPAEFPGVLNEPCQVAGVAIAEDGSVLVLNRGENHWMPSSGYRQEKIQKPAVLVFDSQHGRLMGSWGEGLFVMPHQISVDQAGNIWIVDCGQDKVFKFDQTGSLLLELGSDEIRFRKPTDVVVLSDGSFVVSDGYTNARVAMFSPDGRMIHQWGRKGKEPLQFQTPHSIACDENDLIYVADRENHRIQILNRNGELQSIWTHVERPLTVRYIAGSVFVLSNLDADKGIVRQLNRNGEVLNSFMTKPAGSKEDFEWPHGLAVNEDGSLIYLGFTLTGRRVLRYRRTGT